MVSASAQAALAKAAKRAARLAEENATQSEAPGQPEAEHSDVFALEHAEEALLDLLSAKEKSRTD